MTTTTSPGPSLAPTPSDPCPKETWRIQGIGWERRGFAYEGTAKNDQEDLSFSLRYHETHLALETYSSRPAAFQLVEHLSKTLGKPTTGPDLLNIGELSDSDGEVPTYTGWTFRPDEIAIVREILQKTFPR